MLKTLHKESRQKLANLIYIGLWKPKQYKQRCFLIKWIEVQKMELKNYIRSVKDFPQMGIDFKDIAPLLGDSKALNYTIDKLADMYSDKNIDRIGAFDARGFLFGPTVAYKMQVPFFPFRKAGKLPYTIIQQSYGLEYGNDTLEMHTDAIKKNENILLMDDLLATGGTMKAGCKMVEWRYRYGSRFHPRLASGIFTANGICYGRFAADCHERNGRYVWKNGC